MEAQLTGVGYVAFYQVHSLLRAAPGFDLRFFATRPCGGRDHFAGCRGAFSRRCILPCAGLARYHLWRRFDWPPIEWFCGGVDIAHNFSHQVPATRHAKRMVTVHDLSFLRMPEAHTPRNVRIQRELVRLCVARADALVAVSMNCKRELTELLGIPEEKIYYVPNGVCLEEFETQTDPNAVTALKRRLNIRRDYFIHLGTIEPRKNIPRLLEAHARLRERQPDCPQLVLVGKRGWRCGPICDQIDSHVSSGRVVYVGYVNRADALLLLRNATACIYPSLYEGFGLPVLEAMAAGTPVITSNVSSLPEVVGDTGLLVDPESAESIAVAMQDVLEDPAATAARREAARKRAATFTWEQSAALLAEVYRQVARQRL